MTGFESSIVRASDAVVVVVGGVDREREREREEIYYWITGAEAVCLRYDWSVRVFVDDSCRPRSSAGMARMVRVA